MFGRLKLATAASAAVLLIAPALARAQETGGRFQVLIPYFEPKNGADDGFGKDASKELRSLINTLPTHEAMSEGDIKDQAKKFNMKIEDLNCLYAVQLASQIKVPVAICGSYTEQPDRSYVVDASIRTVTNSETFPLEQFTVPRKDADKEAAKKIFDQFDRYNTQVRSAAICNDYAASQQWENALRNCEQSLEINPSSTSVQLLHARILYEMENDKPEGQRDYSKALAELKKVIEQDPLNADALQLAGYVSTISGDDEAGREFYGRYLDVNPGNVAIRMNIAYEMAKAGDPVGAMEFIQAGLDVDPDNVDLLDQYGGFAFSAAVNAQDEYTKANPDATGVAPDAAEFYHEAINAYTKVFESKGADTPVDRLRNIIAAYIQLDDLPSAISMSERVLQTHPDADGIWSLYADALQRSNRLDDAIAALDKLLELQPDHPTATLREGQWLIQAGRMQDAVGKLTAFAQKGPQQAEQAARMLFNEGYTNGHQQKKYDYAIQAFAGAKQLPNVSDSMKAQLNFWHGFDLFQASIAEQSPNTLATAQSTLPKFQQALQLLNSSGSYPSSVNVDVKQLTDNVNTYIEIQQAIIKRGR